jgi:hypothetical protein
MAAKHTLAAMNFFGHAVVATWYGGGEPDGGAAMALGAMLPDFASMCGARLGPVEHRGVADGVALHHRTDAAFHTLAGFAALCRDAEEALRRAGMRRGPGRGVAHVGVEILLDGALLGEVGARAAYVGAIEAAAPERLGAAIGWSAADGAARFEGLRQRLAVYGVPDDTRDVGSVAVRVTRTLGRRPLLALNATDAEAMRDVLPGLQAAVDAAAPGIIADLRALLDRA